MLLMMMMIMMMIMVVVMMLMMMVVMIMMIIIMMMSMMMIMKMIMMIMKVIALSGRYYTCTHGSYCGSPPPSEQKAPLAKKLMSLYQTDFIQQTGGRQEEIKF